MFEINFKEKENPWSQWIVVNSDYGRIGPFCWTNTTTRKDKDRVFAGMTTISYYWGLFYLSRKDESGAIKLKYDHQMLFL